jgi:hypothetical protein
MTSKVCRDYAAEYLEHYSKIRALFKSRFGYDLFFIGGSLLGLIRDGNFLENDRDMDIAYFSRQSTPDTVADEFYSIAEELISSGQPIDFITENIRIRPNYFVWSGPGDGVKIDVMPYWESKGRLYRPTFVGYEGDSTIILPTKPATFLGREVLIPNRPDEKLAHVYGDTWKVPDKNFKKSSRTDPETANILNSFGSNSRAFSLIKKTRRWKSLNLKDKIALQIRARLNRRILKTIKQNLIK